MKKLVIPLLVGIVAAGTLVLAQPKQAGAAVTGPGYCVPSQTPTGYGSTIAGKTVLQEAKNAHKAAEAADISLCSGSPGVQPHAVLVGTGNPFEYIIVLSHDDVIGAIWTLIAKGYAGMAAWACGEVLPLPWWVSGPACVFGFAVVETLFDDYLGAAANNVTYLADLWADNTGVPGPGDILTPFGYIYPVKQSGLNILLAFPGLPIGLQVNPYAGVSN